MDEKYFQEFASNFFMGEKYFQEFAPNFFMGGPHVGPPTWAPRGTQWGNMGAKYFQEFGPIFLWVKNIFRNLPPFFMGEEYFSGMCLQFVHG